MKLKKASEPEKRTKKKREQARQNQNVKKSGKAKAPAQICRNVDWNEDYIEHLRCNALQSIIYLENYFTRKYLYKVSFGRYLCVTFVNNHFVIKKILLCARQVNDNCLSVKPLW